MKISSNILPGFEMPEAKPVPKPPTKPCTDCPYYSGTYSYFDDRTGKKFAVGHEFSDEDMEHLKTEDYDDSRGDYVNCGVFENRDVEKNECNRDCDRTLGEIIKMSVGEFRACAFVSGWKDPLEKDYADFPRTGEESGDYELIEARGGKVYTRRGRVVYGKRKEVK